MREQDREYDNYSQVKHWVIGDAGAQIIDFHGDRYIVLSNADLSADQKEHGLFIETGELLHADTMEYPVVCVARINRVV